MAKEKGIHCIKENNANIFSEKNRLLRGGEYIYCDGSENITDD